MPLANIQKPNDSAIPKSVEPNRVERQDVLKELGNLLKDEKMRKQVLHSIIDKEKRPPTWSKASCSPYYKEHFALELKKHLDAMMDDREDRMWLFADFKWLSKNSLYLMLNQAFRYLVDRMDTPEQKYANLRQIISVTKAKDKHGTPIGIRMTIVDMPILTAHKITKKEDAWRLDMENFIEEAQSGQVFIAKDLMLSADEMIDLEAFIATFDNIMANITMTSVKLVKQ